MLKQSIFRGERKVRFQPLERRLLFSATPAGAVDAPDDAAVSEDANAADNVDVGIGSSQPSVADLEAQAAGAESLDVELAAATTAGAQNAGEAAAAPGSELPPSAQVAL
ncbi:MAG: LEPR-XLL domain-containing protein, partial [Terrimicrobiaceae bacterium]